VKLYICWGTFPSPLRPGGHPCAKAYHALEDAGYEPELVKSYGFAPLPLVNQTRGRREVQELTGNRWVPTLQLDDGTVLDGSPAIVEWARANPAGSAPARSAPS
jgi:hypothetical protein